MIDGKKEDGDFTIDWLPGRTKRQGVAVLPKEAHGQKLDASVKGYAVRGGE